MMISRFTHIIVRIPDTMWAIFLYVLAALSLYACIVPFIRQNRFRTSLVATYLGLSVFVATTTEGLSLIHAIRRPTVVTLWSCFVVGCLFFFLIGARGHCCKRWKRTFGREVPGRIEREVWAYKGLAFPLVWILFFTFCGALLFAPNTFDAMTYHMTRIMHWLQNQDVSYVVTNDQRLNFQLPLAEFWILHFLLLLKQDFLSNLVQWNAFVISIVTVSLIAAELGMNRKMQWMSAVIMATTPNILFQAQSTQNDLVVCSYVLIFVLMMQKLVRSITMRRIVTAGAAMGLALLAKGTGFIFIAILGTLYGVWILLRNRKKWLLAGVKCLAIVGIGLLFLVPVFSRNLQQYGVPMPANPHKGSSYMVEDWTGLEPLRVFVRSMSLHLGLPCDAWNAGVMRCFGKVFGEALFKTENTNLNTPIRVRFETHEDTLGNFLHLLLFHLFLLCLALSILQKRSVWGRRLIGARFVSENSVDRNLVSFTILSWGAMVMFFTSLCFSFFRARYHVPLFALFSICIAYGLERFLKRSVARGCVMVSLFLCAAWLLQNNPNHSNLYNVVENVRKFGENHEDYYVRRSISLRLQQVEEFCTLHKIKKVLYHNPRNQRDYPIYRVLGGPLQENIQVQRVDYEPGKNYDCPYLLIANNDAPYDEFRNEYIPAITGQLIFSNRMFGLYDLRQKRGSVAIPTTLFSPFSWGLFTAELSDNSAKADAPWSAEMVFSILNPSPSDVEMQIKWRATTQPIGKYRYSVNGEWVEDLIPFQKGRNMVLSIRVPRGVVQNETPISLCIEWTAENERKMEGYHRKDIEEITFSFLSGETEEGR